MIDEWNSNELHTNLDNLRRIGRHRGFPARLRRKIWLILLDVDQSHILTRSQEVLSEEHKDEYQVQLDVNRSFTIALPTTLDSASLPKYKRALEVLIVRTLRRNPYLHYYQGYHDIAQVIYLVMGDAAELALEKLSLEFLRDFMLSSLQPSMTMLRLVHQIVRVADPDLADLLEAIEPFYAIPVLLTWWTHSCESYEEACRFLDFFISSQPSMILFTIAAGVLKRRRDILDCHHDLDMIFSVLSRGFHGDCVDQILGEAIVLSESIRPGQLRHWKNVSSYSCLKTFRAMPSDSDTWRQKIQCLIEAQEKELAKAQEDELQKVKHSVSEPSKFGLLALGLGIFAVGIAWYVQQQSVS